MTSIINELAIGTLIAAFGIHGPIKDPTNASSLTAPPAVRFASVQVEPPPDAANIQKAMSSSVMVMTGNGGTGSGTVIAHGEDGRTIFILTNHHVVEGVSRFRIRLLDRREFDAKLVGTDPLSEVAVLSASISEGPTPPPIEVRDSDTLEIGEHVYVIGSPLKLPFSLSSGIVSAKYRRPAIHTLFEEYVQVDAAVNPGNSGGTGVDRSGRLVFVPTAIYGSSFSNGIAFGISSQVAVAVANELIATGEARHGTLGIQLDDRDEDSAIHIIGVLPFPGQAFCVGDSVIALDGVPAPSRRAFVRNVRARDPGTNVVVRVRRQLRELDLQMTVADLAKASDR